MSKILKRPMFRRGGATSTGIMDGFGESTRPNFANGDSVSDQVKALYEGVDPLEGMEEYVPETGFDTQDYLSLAKLGFSVAGAPGAGPGFSGLMQAAAPSLTTFTDELSANRSARSERERQYEKDVRTAKMDLEKEKREKQIGALGTDAEMGLTREQMANDLKIAEENISDLQYAAKERSRLRALLRETPPGDKRNEYENDLRALDTELNSMKSELLENLGDDTVIGFSAAEIANLPDEERDEKYKGLSEVQIRAQMVNDYIDSLVDDTYIPEYVEPEQNADGGRVGRANGGAMAQGPSAGNSASPLSYEELRSRLPREVSDEVVQLLSVSEQALIDFAQIQTQDDIARFNQRYNTDLMLPSQQAV